MPIAFRQKINDSSGVSGLSAAAFFWPAFWPALAATLGGVVLGLPIALWLNRLAQRWTRSAEESDRRNALSRVAAVLRKSVAENGGEARRLAEAIESFTKWIDKGLPVTEQLNVIPWMETERWEVVREEFVRTSPGPELPGRIAFFFWEVRRVAVMLDRRFELAAGPSAGTDFAAFNDDLLRSLLAGKLPWIGDEARRLDPLLEQLENDGST